MKTLERKIDRSFETDEYRFNEKEHVHQIKVNGEWKNATGVSEAVKDITNFGMAAYYGSRRALMSFGYDPKFTPNNLAKFKRNVLKFLLAKRKDAKKILRTAYTAHSTYAKARADKGTSSHEVISEWIKECIERNDGKPIPNTNPIIHKFMTLVKSLEPRFIATEKHGYNKDLFIGGISDVICETNIGIGIWDMKDRPAIYEKDILQMGGYLHLFPFEFTHVMGIPLEGTEVKKFLDVAELKKQFVNRLSNYRFLNSIK